MSREKLVAITLGEKGRESGGDGGIRSASPDTGTLAFKVLRFLEVNFVLFYCSSVLICVIDPFSLSCCVVTGCDCHYCQVLILISWFMLRPTCKFMRILSRIPCYIRPIYIFYEYYQPTYKSATGGTQGSFEL